MKIQFASDLHLEFPENKIFIKENPILPMAETLILAGDIMTFISISKHKDFFQYLSDNFKSVYWIPGNHEYYGYNLAEKYGEFMEEIHKNIFLLNNKSLIINNVKFIFSTLWSKINENHSWQIERKISDFSLIKYKNYRFNTEIFNMLHHESLTFIKKETSQNTSEKSIVITHHVPTYMHYPEQYKGDLINEAFATELSDFIESSNINYWIYGHHHQNTKDFKIGKTQLLTNQLGYVNYGEHYEFNNQKFFEI